MFPDIPIYIVGHSMGGMIVLRTALNHPDLFAGIIFQGPLIIPGPQLGPFDARVNSFRAAPVKAVLSAFDWFNPEMILGKVGLHMVTRDEEMAKMLKEDELRWRWGCKVSTYEGMWRLAFAY